MNDKYPLHIAWMPDSLGYWGFPQMKGNHFLNRQIYDGVDPS